VFGKILPTPLPQNIRFRWQGSTPNTSASNLRFDFADASGALVGGFASLGSAAPTYDQTINIIPVPAGATAWHLELQQFAFSPDAGKPFSSTATLQYDCAGLNSPTTPCCPPDPNLDIRLTQITQLLYELLSKSGSQGAYVDGPAHTGLSGQGTISISPSSRAIRLDVTSDLGSWPHNVQTPTYFFSLGFVTPYAVGTPLKGTRLIYNHQTFSWPTYTDTIGYTFSPGITANLVELA
jgi:hypothetical protein